VLVQGFFMKAQDRARFLQPDIAGYSRLVAEDEEETLRRLASYRQVTDDFIAKAAAAFSIPPETRCSPNSRARSKPCAARSISGKPAHRNMAYPPSRQMAFRIGITIGDVVERDGDLLGDGVNIARRL
jgi:adenylate cyclase